MWRGLAGRRMWPAALGPPSERAVQALHGLPDTSMLDMGDFAGGLMKYLLRNPVARLTIGGGIGKMTKLAQGARDLHSAPLSGGFHRPGAGFSTNRVWPKPILRLRPMRWLVRIWPNGWRILPWPIANPFCKAPISQWIAWS